MEKESQIKEIFDYYEKQRDRSEQSVILELLRELQEVNGCLTPKLGAQAAKVCGVQESLIQILIRRCPTLKETAYTHEIIVCTGERCSRKQGADILRAVQEELKAGKDGLSADKKVLIRTRCCMKRCASGPNMDIDGREYTKLTPEKARELVWEL